MTIRKIFADYAEFCIECPESLLMHIDTPSPIHLHFFDLELDISIQDPIMFVEDIKAYVDSEPTDSNVSALTALTCWLFECQLESGMHLCMQLRSWISKKPFCTRELYFLLASSLSHGHGCEIDFQEAIRLYRQCLINGWARSDSLASAAYIELAWLYLQGLGTEVDVNIAIHQLEMAYDLNDPEGAFMLGELYDGRLGKFKRHQNNYRLAAAWYTRAGLQGHLRSKTNFAFLHLHMKLPKPDVRLARAYLVEAALEGDAEALAWVAENPESSQ